MEKEEKEVKNSFLGELAAKSKQRLTKEGFKNVVSIFQYVKPYQSKYILGLFALVFSIGTTLLFPRLLGEVLAVIENKSPYTINQVIGVLFIVLVLQAIFSFARIYFFTQVSERTIADIRKSLYAKIISLPVHFFEQRRVGELMSRLTSDVSMLQEVFTTTLAEFLRQVITVIVGIALILTLSWKLTLFMLATFPILIVAAVIFGRYIRTLSAESQQELAKANVIVSETFQSINVVKSYTNEPLELNRYGESMKRVVNVALKTAKLRGVFISFVIFAMFGSIIGIVYYAAQLVKAGELQLNQMMTFIFYTMYIGASLNGLGEIFASIQRSIGASERMLEIMDDKSEVDLSSKNLAINKEDFVKQSITGGEVEFKEVAFSYPSRSDLEVLKGISLKIKAGEKIALVGYSGAGKSTIVQLLLKFYNVETGSILVDGKNISEMNTTELRSKMAIVPQEVMLFGGTIFENIAYGKPNASEYEIISAAKKANAWEFIDTFPDKLETVVGERGIKLSGGQRQRIAIARAILKNPSILLLDEATSALDSESEKLVQGALEVLMEGRTSIIIAHRLSTIRNVDTIYVLKEGKIHESGSHDELVAIDNGIYANLVKMQYENNVDLYNTKANEIENASIII
jgi:ATP-binding cassette, subfamily B, bacterial